MTDFSDAFSRTKFNFDQHVLKPGDLDGLLLDDCFLCPVLLVGNVRRDDRGLLEKALAREMMGKIDTKDIYASYCRGVSADRLSTVLRTGVDVEPSSAGFYALMGLGESQEYGGDGDQLIMGFARRALDHAGREIDTNNADDIPLDLQANFPTAMFDEARKKVWLSKLPESDPRAATAYAVEYSYWIPGDPRDAVKYIIFLSDNDLNHCQRLISFV